jgi:hypothetical protein
MDAPLFQRFVAAHRALDELFGSFLAALERQDAEGVTRAMAGFDAALRRHTAEEEEALYPAPEGGKLAAAPAEGAAARRARELRLEHVQIRELSGMILRLAADEGDLAGARRLAGNLARRWDAHTTREEREVFRPER